MLNLLLSLLCLGAPLISGEPIPVGISNGLGSLAVDKIFNHPVGAAHALGNAEPDLFVLDVSRFYPDLVVLPFLRRDASGTPIFGNVSVVTSHEIIKFDKPGTIFEFKGVPHALWIQKNDLVHLTFSRKDLAFTEQSRMALPSLPRPPSCIGWLPDAEGDGFTLLMGISDGVRESPPMDGFDSRDPRFMPYDGAGVWRGKFPYATLYTTHIPGLLHGPIGEVIRAATTDREVRSTYERLTRVDFGKDRTRDVIGGSLHGPLYYYHATTTPLFEAYRNLVGSNGILLRHPTIGAGPAVYPAKNGRWSDLLVGGEGAIYYYRFLDTFSSTGQPVYAIPAPALQKDAALYTGSLPVVNVADWDGDGTLDIVTGNSEGRILFFRNAGTNVEPAFKNAVALEAGGAPIFIQAGYEGSIQGPGEARWGYLCPTVVDWNNDGLPDIVTSGVTGHHSVYLNEGRRKKPKLAPSRMIYLDGLALHGTWRCQPGIAILDGRMAYVALDDQDEFHLYWQIDAQNVADGGKLTLDTGEVMCANYLKAGGTGRIKIVLYDWDEDGVVDILVGTPRHSSIPNPKRGLPQALGKPGSAVMFLRNTGTNAAPKFARPKMFAYKGTPTFFEQHACSPAVAPFGRGNKPGLIVGKETGRLYYFAPEDISFVEMHPPEKQ